MEFIFEEKKEAIKPNLTPCEKAILKFLLQGMSNKDISIKLCVSKETIKTHRRKIYEKHDVHSLAFLLKYYLK